MAKLIADLPPHCRIKNRGKYADVYFMVHPKDRPEGWPATIKLGRTDKNSASEILKKANEVFDEFEEYRIAQATGQPKYRPGSLPALIEVYKQSPFWQDLSDRTKKDYNEIFAKILEWSRKATHPHIKLLTAKSIYKWMNQEWSGQIRRQKYARTVLSIIYQTAIREGEVSHNIARTVDIQRQKREDKKEITLWSQEDIDAFVKEADARGLYSLGSIVLTGIETAQRQQDILKMRRGADYKDGQLAYLQQKTGKTIWLNATEKLQKRYREHSPSQMFMFISERTQRPWKPKSLSENIRKICDYLGMENHVFAHLRHSQVNYLYSLELSDEVIIAMTGHEEPQTMRTHYREKINADLANKGVAKINQVRQKGGQGGKTK